MLDFLTCIYSAGTENYRKRDYVSDGQRVDSEGMLSIEMPVEDTGEENRLIEWTMICIALPGIRSV